MGNCAACGATVSADEKFCANCGAPVTSSAPAAASCPACGRAYSGEERFCAGCGRPVAPSEAATLISDLPSSRPSPVSTPAFVPSVPGEAFPVAGSVVAKRSGTSAGKALLLVGALVVALVVIVFVVLFVMAWTKGCHPGCALSIIGEFGLWDFIRAVLS